MAASYQVFCIVLFLSIQITFQSLLTGNGHGLPELKNNERDDNNNRIILHHQAIIYTYRFDSCGNITEWGTDVFFDIQNSITLDFQVWRPSPTVKASIGTGCYSLVGNNKFSAISLRGGVARVTPSPQDYIQFRPGDVLGFYVEDVARTVHPYQTSNGIVLKTSPSRFTSELVWFGKVAPTVAASKNLDCPYSVGSDGILKLSTHAAPVISIGTTSYSCPASATHTHVLSTAIINDRNANNSAAMPENNGTSPTPLILAIVTVMVVVVSVSTIAVLILIITILMKQQRTRERHIQRELSNDDHKTEDPSEDRVNIYGDDPASGNLQTSTESRTNVKNSSAYHCEGPSSSKEAAGTSGAKSSHHYQEINSFRLGDRYEIYHPETLPGETETEAATAYETPIIRKDRGTQSRAIHPSNDVFDSAGSYVPTAEARTSCESEGKTKEVVAYSKLRFFEEEQIYWAPASTTSALYSQLASKKYREIARKQIKLLEPLGSGQFGQVCKAEWSISGATKKLAVKNLRPDLPEEEKVRFLQEAAIMGQFCHPCIVRLYGVVTVGYPVMICIELMINGDLRNYLCTINPVQHDHKKLGKQFLQFSQQIASGMDYLSKKSFIHRDLAARNILLDEALHCKIGDFGMARDLMDKMYYTSKSKGGKIPVKWTAPEALYYKKYSTDSDVWSYGMVLFEIWSVGKKPFSRLTNVQVLKLLKTGHCQPPPPGCPRAIYKLMVDCWNPDHHQRPTFEEICDYLQLPLAKLLYWSLDNDGSRDSSALGAALETATQLHLDLQDNYKQLK